MYQWGMLNSVCWSVMTWTSSCFITRAQLYGVLPVLGLARAMDLAGAGTHGGDEGQGGGPSAELLVVLHDLDLGQAGRLVTKLLTSSTWIDSRYLLIYLPRSVSWVGSTRTV